MTEPRPQRKSPRLQGYDYAQHCAYFVTIYTHDRVHLFGEIANGEMRRTVAGHIAHKELVRPPSHWQNIDLDLFVVMPNHLHLIVVIYDQPDVQKPKHVPQRRDIVGNYKSGVTRRIRVAMQSPELKVWQGRYHDHIIRNESSLNRIRTYVQCNPVLWTEDIFYGAQ